MRSENLTLGTKFTLLLSVVFVLGVVISGVVLWQVLQRNAQNEITMRGLILLQTMNSVRNYTSTNLSFGSYGGLLTSTSTPVIFRLRAAAPWAVRGKTEASPPASGVSR